MPLHPAAPDSSRIAHQLQSTRVCFIAPQTLCSWTSLFASVRDSITSISLEVRMEDKSWCPAPSGLVRDSNRVKVKYMRHRQVSWVHEVGWVRSPRVSRWLRACVR